jgi:altronate hydrolase
MASLRRDFLSKDLKPELEGNGFRISGEKTIEQMGEAILDYVIRVANGEVRTKAELKGQEGLIPWKRGLSL